MKLNDFYPEIESACHALHAFVVPILTKIILPYDLSLHTAEILLAIPSFEPNPVNAATFRIRSPYIAESHYEDSLKRLYQLGLLDPAESNSYHINQTGMSFLDALKTAIHGCLSSFQTLQSVELSELADRLKRLSDACFRSAPPPGHWAIQHTRRLDPGNNAALMVLVDQRLTELKAYREDAQLASWMELIDNGHAWEILTLLWTGHPRTAEEINTMLARRGHSLDQTKRALVVLLKKRWIFTQGTEVHVTPLGIKVRDAAEERTDQLFYAPFGYFNTFELEKTYELLLKHRREIPSI